MNTKERPPPEMKTSDAWESLGETNPDQDAI